MVQRAGANRGAWAFVALLAAAVVVAVVVVSSGGSAHRVYATVPDATNVIAGQSVREAGQIVGSVSAVVPVRGGRAVRLSLDIDDGAWPLRAGSTMTLRWGGTVNYDNRYIALARPAGTAPALRDGATIPARDFQVPVEFDQLLTAFTPGVRRDIRAFFHRGGDAFQAARRPLRDALISAPPALTQVNAVIDDLHADTRSLDVLVRSTGSVVDAIDSADPGLGDLVAGAATTFRATAGQATAMQDTLVRAPRTLAQVRHTLGHADTTLTAASDLARRIRPGVTQVQRIASPLNHVLGTVVDVGPDARATLAAARRATPSLNPLLTKATALMPGVRSIGRQSVEALRCIRPYTPDILAFFTNWGDFLSATDGRDKYIRATVQQLVPAPQNTSSQTSADAVKAFPGLHYAFPRPPGYNAGQPWFLPECGAGPDALDPAKDPESRATGPLTPAPPLQPIGGVTR